MAVVYRPPREPWISMCSSAVASSSRALARRPASIGRIPPSDTRRITFSLASRSSPAANTSSCCPPTSPAISGPAKLVLNAFTSATPSGASAAISWPPEPNGPIHSRSRSLDGAEVDWVSGVDDHGPAQLTGILAHDMRRLGVGDGEHGHLGIEVLNCPDGALTGQLVDERLRLADVSADEVGLVTASEGAGGDRPAHPARPENRDLHTSAV